MRASTKLLLGSVALSAAACGGPSAPHVATTPTTPIASTPPPAPTRARWTFSHPERGLTAKLDLGGGQTLFVGQYGRRALAKGDEPLVDAPTLALEHLVGVVKDGNGDFAFVAEDGDIYVSHDALGTLDVVRNGPLGEAGPDGKTPKFAAVATGRAAIVGLTSDGRMLRSADAGKQWSPVDYAASSGSPRPYGHAVSLALDTRGNGLLLMFPQRLFVTHDDGATWAPIATPGIGASAVRRDGADQLFLQASEHAKFDGAKLVVTQEPLEPLRNAKTGTATTDAPARTLLAGNRVVELTFHKGARPSVEVASHALGESSAPGSGASSGDLVSAATSSSTADGGVSPHIAGWGSSLLYARADDTKDADGAVTTTILRSNDHGATWKTDATFKGHLFDNNRWSDRDARAIALGPNGWAYVRAMCPPGSGSESSEKCLHRQIRPAGSTGFEDMAAVEDFVPLRFVFDEAHGHVYALGRHEDRLHVYESPLAQNKFTRMKLLDVQQGSHAALTVDPGGVLRVLVQDLQNQQWKLLRHSGGDAELPVLYAPIDAGEVALVGLRGIVSGGHRAWETADGGESWVRVAASGSSGDLACTDAGCTMGGAERVGWELPAYQGKEKVVASTEPKKASSPPPHARPSAPVAPLELACKPGGATTPVASTPGTDTVDLRPSDVRWSEVKEDKDHRVSIIVGGRTTVRELPMLGAEPPQPVAKPGAPPPAPPTTIHRTTVFRLADGVAAVRAVQTPKVGETAPVDLDIAWFSPSTGRVTHHALAKFKPFAVSKWGPVGEAHVVDGGVVFQSVRGEPAHFLRDDGKEETLSIPNSASVTSLTRMGTRWLLSYLSGGSARMTFSDDAGKTWTTKTWRLDDYGSLSVGTLGGKPYLGLVPSTGTSTPTAAMVLFSLASIGDDPPPAVVVPPGAADAPCDAQATTMRSSGYMPPDARPLSVRIDEADKTTSTSRATERVIHPTASNGLCTAAYRVGSLSALVYADAKGYSGFRFKWTTDPKDTSKRTLLAEPLACAAAAK